MKKLIAPLKSMEKLNKVHLLEFFHPIWYVGQINNYVQRHLLQHYLFDYHANYLYFTKAVAFILTNREFI